MKLIESFRGDGNILRYNGTWIKIEFVLCGFVTDDCAASQAQELQRQRHGQGQSKNVKVNDLGGQGVGTRGFVGWHQQATQEHMNRSINELVYVKDT